MKLDELTLLDASIDITELPNETFSCEITNKELRTFLETYKNILSEN